MEKRDVVDNIIKYIKAIGGKCIKTNGDYKPDIFGCVKGRCIIIECKDKGKLNQVTEGQRIELTNWRNSGALAFACDDPKYAKMLLEDL